MKHKATVALFHCGFIYSGGGERIVLEEALGLAKRGYKTLVYAPTLDSARCYPELIKQAGVKVFFPTFLKNIPFRNAVRMIVSSFLAPLLAFGFRQVDVFIGANQPGIWIAYCMAKILHRPYIVYLNQPNRIIYPRPVDLEYGWYTTERDYHLLYKLFRTVKPLLAFLDRLSIRSANAVLTNGSYIKGVIENVYSITCSDAPAAAYAQPRGALSKTDVFHGSVNVAQVSIAKPYFLITNRHDPQKRFDYVIQAFARAKEGHANVRLVIPGPFTAHTPELVNLANKLKMNNDILFLGQITEGQLQLLYKNAACYCYPSPQEDFGLGPIEAGGWGVPTVAWNSAGPTVTVDDGITGFLARPYDIDDYAHKMLTIIESPKLREKMGAAAWERTKNVFSWDNHISVLAKQVEAAINPSDKVE